MAKCSSCDAVLVPGSMFCDGCGATQDNVKVARKLRQKSFTQIKNAKEGILAPGEQIKSRRHWYVIEEAIARSGFGATFRALRKKDRKQVLIKQMLEQSTYDQFRREILKSFKREAKFLKKIKHPAFARGFDSFERNRSIYLVMEFINGKELAKAIEDYRAEKGKIPDGLIVYLGIEIAEALEIIHDYGFIYRDLKPQNVMLDGISAKVKMIDFGTLYHPGDSEPLVFESEGYTPPEFLDTNNPWTAAGDIYSLGALLYEIANGDTPQKGQKLNFTGNRDQRLCKIIERCLDQDPAKRYQRARNVRNELSKLTRKGFLFFRKKNAITPIELNVLPKALYPSQCTFCDYCGFADPNSQIGYCKKCRIPLRVGRLTWKVKDKKGEDKEFFLYSDETIVGKSPESHINIRSLEGSKDVSARHIRVFRRKNSLWIEALERNKENTRVNNRRILGPVELMEGDVIEIASLKFTFTLLDAC